MNENLGSTGTFALFVAVNVVSLMFVRTFVPETKGHSLEDLETRFRPGRGCTYLTHTTARSDCCTALHVE